MQKFDNVRNIYINSKKNIHVVIGGNMIMIKKLGFLMVNCFAQDGIKKVRQFIKSCMIQNLVNVQ